MNFSSPATALVLNQLLSILSTVPHHQLIVTFAGLEDISQFCSIRPNLNQLIFTSKYKYAGNWVKREKLRFSQPRRIIIAQLEFPRVNKNALNSLLPAFSSIRT